MKKIISIIATVIASVIGTVLCVCGTIMPFDSDYVYYAPAVTFLGALLLFVPWAILWRKREHGAYVTAATIIGVALVLAAALLPGLGFIQ